jgi:hypothetical protein
VTGATADIARGIDPHGELYQRRGFAALPVLVRQAHAGQTIYYGELAAELGIPNPRTLNFVLGAVGTSLVALGRQWGEEIPTLQALVINRAEGIPGPGFVHSLVDPQLLSGATRKTRKQVVDGMLAAVFTYAKWDRVLAHFGLTNTTLDPDLPQRAAVFRGSGESEAHRALKKMVAANPSIVGIGEHVQEAIVEYRLPTGDEIDVLLRTRRRVVAVEVKSAMSPEEDLARGVFQCVKYEALLNALSASLGTRENVEAILVLGGSLTSSTRALSNALGVRVLESIDVGRN